MDPRGTARLREEQIKALQETTEKIDKLKSYVSDYKALSKRLNTLSDKTKHDVTVPFGKFAFMPGQLVHTNEVLVLLGDNWFCERSAKQAADIAERRIESLNRQMKDLEKQKGLLEPRLNYTTELQKILEEKSGVVEIKEEYDPEAERIWRERHRESVKAHKRQRQNGGTAEDTKHDKFTKNTITASSDDAFWQRLDELEVQERRNREMSLLSKVEVSDTPPATEIPHEMTQGEKKQVKWKDWQETTSKQEEDEDSSAMESVPTESESEDSDDYFEDNGDVLPPKVITFTHTPTSDGDLQETVASDKDSECAPLLMSPADIFTHFVCTPKSILKHPTEKFETKAEEIQKMKSVHHIVEMSHLAGEPEPFTGTVVEKIPPHPVCQDDSDDTGMISQIPDRQRSFAGAVFKKSLAADTLTGQDNKSHDTSADQKPVKKVSRFKARQMMKSE